MEDINDEKYEQSLSWNVFNIFKHIQAMFIVESLMKHEQFSCSDDSIFNSRAKFLITTYDAVIHITNVSEQNYDF